ncbi:MAG: Holliday junction DNA helicase RuvA [Thermoguttaceae bacterium]|nr:Holliday junction DNA helicase RuvA [Thermoguttaceae bacterium]
MITKITGKLITVHEERIILSVPPFEYEVLIPEYTRRQLQNDLNREVVLHTIEYFDGNPMQGRMVPRLLGFLTEVEREFFDLFCSVDGVGSKKALRAIVRPVREIAIAIEEQNVKFLSGLPGIGAATAERIVAKLHRKVPKFALMVARTEEASPENESIDIVAETFDALLSLGHSEVEARRLIDSVVNESKKKFKDSAELIQLIYMNNR